MLGFHTGITLRKQLRSFLLRCLALRPWRMFTSYARGERGTSSHFLWAAYVCSTRSPIMLALSFVPIHFHQIVEVIGFIGRILSSDDIWALGPFIMQSLLLLVAPALFAASIYIILGRIILLTDGEEHSAIRQKWLTKLFVGGDVLSFLLQGGGGGIQAAGTLELLHTGEKIIIAGLFVQLAFFGLFIFVAALFHWRLVRANPKHPQRGFTVLPTTTAASRRLTESSTAPLSQNKVDIHSLPWKRYIITLYAAAALIMIRSVFRVIEYLQGNNGYLMRHEVFLYVFDGTLMLGVVILFNFVHPATITDLYQQRKMEERTEYALRERNYMEA